MEKTDGRRNNKGHPTFTKENAREMQLRGAEVRKKNTERRRKMKEELEILLRATRKKKGKVLTAEDIQGIAEDKDINCDMQTAILMATLKRADMGDMQAIQFIRDTIGEKPTDKVEIDASKTIEEYAKNHKLKL